MEVLLIGGPRHGQTLAVDKRDRRVEVQAAPSRLGRHFTDYGFYSIHAMFHTAAVRGFWQGYGRPEGPTQFRTRPFQYSLDVPGSWVVMLAAIQEVDLLATEAGLVADWSTAAEHQGPGGTLSLTVYTGKAN